MFKWLLLVALFVTPLFFVPSSVHAAGAQPLRASSDGGRWYFGQCTWWAAYLRPDIGSHMYGDAWYWPDAAMAQGLPNGGEPKVGSVVTFQPFIQSAGPVGHVAVVLAVNLDGSYLMTEMNATCGWDCVDQRTSLPGRGVRFLY